MQTKSIILLLLALACGLVAAIGVTQALSKRPQETIVMGETLPILVAKETVPAWTPLSAQHVKLEAWPKDRVPEGAISQIETVEGRRTKTPLYPGEPILEKKLFDKNANEHGPTVMIPKGLRVVTVKVDQVSSGSGLILPGDRVDVAVVLRPDPTKGITEPITQTFLQDIKVFAVNDQFHVQGTPQEEKSIQAKTVSLLVTPEQAQMILVASEAGKIQLVMRSPEEQDQAQIKPVRLRDILDVAEKADREKESLVPEAVSSKEENPLLERFKEFLKTHTTSDNFSTLVSASGAQVAPEPSKAPAEQWGVRILKAAQVEDVVLEKSPHGWKVANSTVYGPPSSGSQSNPSPGAGGTSAGATKTGQRLPGDPSDPQPPHVSPPGQPASGSPGAIQPADLPHVPTEVKNQPGRRMGPFSENPPERLRHSGEEEVPQNLVLPLSDEG